MNNELLPGQHPLRNHVVLPLLVLAVGSTLLMGLGLDREIAAWLYQLEGGRWALKNAWLLEQGVHNGGRRLSIIASLAVLGLVVVSRWLRPLAPARRALLRLFASVAITTLVVALLKRATGMDCPWDLGGLGGSHAFHGLFETRPPGFHASGCFPAGHASAGYAWVALYFMALDCWPRWRRPALLAGLALGMLFGVAQQLRGAHFLSHDLWTAAIAWFTALGAYRVWPPRRPCATGTGSAPTQAG